MKKLPLVFCLLFLACSEPKQIVSITTDFNKYKQPYHIFSVGLWNADHVVLTLTDVNNTYFTVRASNNPSFKKGDIYKP